jgi:5S rRNA maturation endonuclease (ribonuclease M5)
MTIPEESLKGLIETPVVVLVEGADDVLFIKSLILNLTELQNKNMTASNLLIPEGLAIQDFEGTKIQKNLKQFLSLVKNSLPDEVKIRKIIVMIDGDEKDRLQQCTQFYTEQFKVVPEYIDTSVLTLKDFTQNQFQDLESLLLHIAKPEYQNEKKVVQAFIDSAIQNKINLNWQPNKTRHPKRELAVFNACLKDFHGTSARVILNNFNKYFDITHEDLKPLLTLLKDALKVVTPDA